MIKKVFICFLITALLLVNNTSNSEQLITQDIKILYGNNYSEELEKSNITIETDVGVVNESIRQLEDNIKIYDNLIKKLNEDGYSFSIYLVKDFKNDKTIGRASIFKKDLKLYISNKGNFERAFHHEMLHIIEYYLSDKFGNSVFEDWNNYNPKDFEYLGKNVDTNYEYSYRTFLSKDYYFITKYSKVSEKEDRAEIYAEYMTSGKCTKSEFTNNKLNYLLGVLGEYNIL